MALYLYLFEPAFFLIRKNKKRKWHCFSLEHFIMELLKFSVNIFNFNNKKNLGNATMTILLAAEFN